MMNNIAEQLALAYQQLAKNCVQHGVAPNIVQLIAVSKTQPASAITLAYQAGQRHFAENYPQELLTKADTLAALTDIDWHFIGPLQSNKTQIVARYANWMHSLDRLKIAKRLSEQRTDKQVPLKVLIQINISDETSKSGITPAALLPFAEEIACLPGLELRGVMAIPAPASAVQRATDFAAMQQLSGLLQQYHPKATELSMGMSDDWPLALRYGATMIRLGTAIFGARNYE